MTRKGAALRSPAAFALLAALILLAGADAARAEPGAVVEDSAAPTPAERARKARDERIARYRAIARTEAEQRGLPPAMADAVMKVESNYNPAARGKDGEYGLMQVMPPTARMLGLQGPIETLAEPETNIRLGVRYLAEAGVSPRATSAQPR